MALADAHGKLVVPHGSSVYSYHFVVTQHNSPFAEFLMMHPEPSQVVPMFAPPLAGEPVPRNGRLKIPERPGFGVELDPASGAHKLDWEVELAVVIGRQARYLESPEAAAGVIAGYTVSNDVSERAFQVEVSGGQWSKGKCCETARGRTRWVRSRAAS